MKYELSSEAVVLILDALAGKPWTPENDDIGDLLINQSTVRRTGETPPESDANNEND